MSASSPLLTLPVYDFFGHFKYAQEFPVSVVPILTGFSRLAVTREPGGSAARGLHSHGEPAPPH